MRQEWGSLTNDVETAASRTQEKRPSTPGERRRKKMRRIWIPVSFVFLIGLGILGNKVEAAEQYPTKPITYIIPVEAGADGDILSRPLCQKASAVLGQPMMIVNKPGAGSTIGYREIYGAKPDGYTIGAGMVTIVTNKLQGLLPYDYRDFSLIATFYTSLMNVFGSTRTNRPFKTIEEAISFAKAHPGEVSVAAGAVGQSGWIGAMAFITGTGINVSVIPQAGAGGLVAAQVAGGHTDLGVLPLPAAKPQIEAGNVRFLASLGSRQPFPPYDNVPTLKELGYDVIWEGFGIVMGPPKMPKDVIERLAKAFEVAANDPEYHKFLIERSTIPFHLPPDKIIPFCDERRKVVRNIMEKAGILKEK